MRGSKILLSAFAVIMIGSCQMVVSGTSADVLSEESQNNSRPMHKVEEVTGMINSKTIPSKQSDPVQETFERKEVTTTGDAPIKNTTENKLIEIQELLQHAEAENRVANKKIKQLTKEIAAAEEALKAAEEKYCFDADSAHTDDHKEEVRGSWGSWLKWFCRIC